MRGDDEPLPAGPAAHPRGPTPPFDRPPPCAGGRRLSRAESLPRDVVSIGPLVFVGLGRRLPAARFRRATSFPPHDAGVRPLTVPVIVPPLSRATIAVPLDARDVAGLTTGPPPRFPMHPFEARRAVVCSTGPAQRTFEVSFVVDGARCLPVSVTFSGRTLTERVAFGRDSC